MMAKYTNILVAVDLSPDSEGLMNHAQQLAELYDAKLNLIHVTEHPAVVYEETWGSLDTSELEASIDSSAKAQLANLSEKYGITSQNCFLESGSPKQKIHEVAEAQGIDLIVVGSHGRSGAQLLLGSTANAVLHGAKCDVLAVRM